MGGVGCGGWKKNYDDDEVSRWSVVRPIDNMSQLYLFV